MRYSMVLVWLMGMLLVACGRNEVEEPAPPPAAGVSIRGTITGITPAEGGQGMLGTILVEGVLEEDTSHDRASIRITEESRLFSGEGREVVSFEELAVGQRVEATFTGPVLESYPVQATADEVVILPAEE